MANADQPLGPDTAHAFLDAWCLHCHDATTAKGKLNMEPLMARLAAADRTVDEADLLRRIRARVADGMMPPAGKEQPTAADRAAVLPVLEALMAVAPEQIVPPATPPRRLNRTEYANTVRDLFGVDVWRLSALPADDVGANFDNVATVLSLSPAAFERFMELAEAIAQQACPDDAQPKKKRHKGKDLKMTSQSGQAMGDVMGLWSNGTAERSMDFAREGTYSITVRAFGQQAGPEPVRMAIMVDGKAVAEFALPETEKSPGDRRVETTIPAGKHRVGAAFLNDLYVKGPPAQDRNMAVVWLEVEGPLDSAPQQAWLQQLQQAGSEPAQWRWLVERTLRRPATAADDELCSKVAQAAGTQQRARLRAVITALLVHPEFLFRTEADVPSGPRVRDLTGPELAARLSYFLWASTPDDALRHAAAAGALATPAGRAAQVERMLQDPRSSSLAERFAPQWLGIDGLETRSPDPQRFAGIDPALLQSMRTETVLLFDSVLRENRPATTLLNADYTFVDSKLAAHYGMPAPAADGMRRVPAPPGRGGGVLAQASVLLCTSNPTRTSPVKRGKWVLESLLDSAPPPPPPGTPQLPERPEDRHGLTLRQSLERHRADPACAACHLRMDALGFAFEHYDAVGRYRDRTEGAAVDSQGQLPDGRTVGSVEEVRALLLADPAYVRSLAKHLLIYATGRAPSPADEAAVDLLVQRVGPAPTLRALVAAVVESPAFLRRGAPPAPAQPVGAGE